jgi:hypothetical protein
MKYRRLPKTVEAEPMAAFDFLLLHDKWLIDGGRKADYRAGYKINCDGAISWLPKDQFEKEFVEVNDD